MKFRISSQSKNIQFMVLGYSNQFLILKKNTSIIFVLLVHPNAPSSLH